MTTERRTPGFTPLLVGLAAAGIYFAYVSLTGQHKEGAAQEASQPAAAARTGRGGERASGKVDPAARKAAEQRHELRTEHFVATFTNLNGGLVSFRLLGERYRDDDGQPFELVTTDKEPYLPLRVDVLGVAIPEDAVWEVERLDARTLRFRWRGDGVEIVRRVQAGKGPYQLWVTTRVRNLGTAPRRVRVREAVFHYVPRDLEGGAFFAAASRHRADGVCLYEADEVVRKDRKALLEPHGYGPPAGWAGVETTYFAKVVAAEGDVAERCQLWSDDRFLPGQDEAHGSLFHVRLKLKAEEIAPGSEARWRALAYFGPKEPEALAAAGHRLKLLVDLGWFAFIGEYLVALLGWFHGLVGNWGLAIILLTVFIKLLLFPLTESSFRSMARMRRLKPEMDRINERYKDEPEKKGVAIMELYRKHRINPLGGCLPTLLQIPVWFALYRSLSTNIELYHAEFALWWTDLSAPDPYFVLPVAVGALMFVQQKLTPSTMDPAQAKMMMYLMPAMMTAFLLFLPAGLCLYILTNSSLSIAQQRYIEWRLGREESEVATAGSGPDEVKGDDGEGASAGSPVAGGGPEGDPSDAGVGAGRRSSVVSVRKVRRKKRRQRRG